MSVLTMIDPHTMRSGVSEDRREWIRIEDKLLLEYRLEGEQEKTSSLRREMVTDEMIAAAVEKPTTELLARSGDLLAQAALIPWIMKVDWLLEVLLKTLAKAHPGCMELARVTTVNISGGGIGFVASQRFNAGDRLALRVILPPFTPIQVVAKVIRSSPDPQGQGFVLAAEFVDLGADEQDHLVRYVLQTQAERLRTRKKDEQSV
ncbi:MAG: PilZ domain-containing protein [Nitrospira sp.]|nr:PilZ domain-containing protein [Nitrospira sp.]MCP9442253.1 PilZ domain-containing protein [Nitrospira sp.]